jgi:hypothetical protein
MAVHGTTDMVVLFDTPDHIGIERNRDKCSRAGFGDMGLKTLYAQAVYLHAKPTFTTFVIHDVMIPHATLLSSDVCLRGHLGLISKVGATGIGVFNAPAVTVGEGSKSVMGVAAARAADAFA